MMDVNHIRDLNIALSDWERYESISKEQFLADRDAQNMVLHAMFMSIQAAIDAGAWLISSHKIPKKPTSYRETFEILAIFGVIDPELGSALADLASLRNVIIHQYSVLDLDEIWRVLIHERCFLVQFIEILAQNLKKT